MLTNIILIMSMNGILVPRPKPNTAPGSGDDAATAPPTTGSAPVAPELSRYYARRPE